MANLKVSTGTQSDSTLLGILQRNNPGIVDRWDGASYKNTKSSTGIFDAVQLDDNHPTVQRWKDFTYDAIHLAYGDVLDQKISAFRAKVPELRDYQLVDNPPKTPTIIVNENDVDTLGIVWSCNILRGPIKAAASLLRPRMSTATEWSATVAPKKVSWAPRDAKNNVTLNPDWVIMDHKIHNQYPEEKENQPTKPLIYGLGDSKLKQKWKSSWLSLPDNQLEKVLMDTPIRSDKQTRRTITDERLRPLHQIATYCRFALTRYAYIVTQTEVVAMRVRRITAKEKSRHYAAIEYASIPWSATARDGLTANLAIWAVGCMGMNDAHRAMEGKNHEPLDKMAKLTWWRHDTSNNCYENVISKRKIPDKEWKKEWEKFVQLLDDPGNSHTKDFDTGSRPSTSGSSTGGGSGSRPGTAGPGTGSGSGTVADLSKKMGAVNLGSTAASGPASRSSSRPAATVKECKVNKQGPYQVTVKDKKYHVTLNKTSIAIEKDDNGYYVKYNGKKLPVEMLRST